MPTLEDAVEEWLWANQHKKFVSSDNLEDHIDARKGRIGRVLQEVTEEQWGKTQRKFLNPYYSDEAHHEHYKNQADPSNDSSGLESFQ